MYNLLVSANDESWDREDFFIDSGRLFEHTDKRLVEKFSELSEADTQKLMSYPCIFAYEKPCKKDPKFGYITGITKRQQQVRIEYKIINLETFLSYKDLERLLFELDINKYELNRTHYALKDVDLYKELEKIKIELPKSNEIVDISTHKFDVTLSFPGEFRDYVREVNKEVEKLLGKNSCFYDNDYKAQLARPSLDTLLQNIYRNQSKLIVVFLSQSYQQKDWCGLEFRAIKEIIMNRDHEKIMFVKMDDGKVEGVFKTDGYIDGRTHTPQEVASYINDRVKLILKEDI